MTILLVIIPSVTFALDPAPKASQPDPKMEAFQKASTPGEEHKLLSQFVGKWDHVVSWWMSPDAQPEVSKGNTEIESILGGRFIRQHVTGTSMGQPFEGIGITGYDNLKQNFTTMWIDNMSTGAMSGIAHFDKQKNALIDTGSFSCPMSPTGTQSYQAVWELPVRNAFKYEMFGTSPEGKSFRMMEIVYKKVG